jgi:hypothetical protein
VDRYEYLTQKIENAIHGDSEIESMLHKMACEHLGYAGDLMIVGNQDEWHEGVGRGVNVTMEDSLVAQLYWATMNMITQKVLGKVSDRMFHSKVGDKEVENKND